jgi:hypothetical protein
MYSPKRDRQTGLAATMAAEQPVEPRQALEQGQVD